MSGHIPSWPPRPDVELAGWLGDAHDGESPAWMLYELEYARRAAQTEANVAYLAWCQLPGRAGYAVYRAAQDRADAAQDAVAAWVRAAS